MAEKKIFTSANYDGKTCLQLQIEVSESGFATDGSYSTVVADYYLISVVKPSGLNGDVTSDYGTGQTFSCSIGSISQTFSTNAFAIANAINKAGDKFKIGTLSTKVKRSGDTGAGNVKVASSCTLTWRSGYPSRSISGTYSCINTKHIIEYDANGGNNAPSNQVKYYGYVLNLRNEIPTRVGYLFKGWSTKKDGNVEYQNGGRFGHDANTTLYAIWKMVDVKIDLTPVDIKIPCEFRDGISGFKYFYCDSNYSIDIPYTYSFPDKITSAFVSVGNSEYIQLYSDTGTIKVGMNDISEAIKEYGKNDEVLFNMRFKFAINNDVIEIPTTVICPLIDFNFVDISIHHSYVDKTSNNLLYITFVCTYPKSFNPDIKYVNSYPLIVYEDGTSIKSLTCVGRKDISDNAFLITYNLNINGLSNPLRLRSLKDVLLYNDAFRSESTLTKSMFQNKMSLYFSSINKNIIFYKNKTIEAREFVEIEYLNGFYKGGIICMKEFIESNETTEFKIDSNKIINAKLLIETKNADSSHPEENPTTPIENIIDTIEDTNVSQTEDILVSELEN